MVTVDTIRIMLPEFEQTTTASYDIVAGALQASSDCPRQAACNTTMRSQSPKKTPDIGLVNA